MPRKPSSVFLIAEPMGSTGIPMQAWRIPLGDDSSIERIIAAHYMTQPLGTRLYAVEDTKVEAFDIIPSVTAIDDPRLEQSE